MEKTGTIDRFLPFRQVHLDFHTSEHVTGVAADFDPEKYKDEYWDGVRDLIERKEKGEKIVTAPVEFEEGKVIDLKAALERSLEKVRGEKPAPKRAKSK